MSWSSRKKKESIFWNVYFFRSKFFWTFVFFISVYNVLNKLQNMQNMYIYIYIYIYIYTFSIKKHYFIHFCYLFSKPPKPSVSLKDLCVDKNGTIMFARKRATCMESTMISSLLQGRRVNFERRCRINGQGALM